MEVLVANGASKRPRSRGSRASGNESSLCVAAASAPSPLPLRLMKRRFMSDPSRLWDRLGAFVAIRRFAQDFRLSIETFVVHFIEPPTRTAQNFTHQRLRLSRSFDRPL